MNLSTDLIETIIPNSVRLAIEGKIWPRLSAHAERFWTDPDTKWLAAETRMHMQRERWDSFKINSN